MLQVVLSYMVTSKINLEKKDQSGPDRKTNMDLTCQSLLPYFEYVSCEGSDKTVQLFRLVSVFTACL